MNEIKKIPEELLNEAKETEDFGQIYDIIHRDVHECIQPVLYLKKAPDNNSILKDFNDELLHTSPIISSGDLNLYTLLPNLDDKEFINAIGPSANYLASNQKHIAHEQFANYIIQNTIIGFCAMIDNTGDLFRSMVNNTRIKQIVSEELLNNNTNNYGYESIEFFIYRFVNSIHENTYEKALGNNLKESEEMLSNRFNALRINNEYVANQLNQLIYTKLCKACDKAISEILLGTRVSPNVKYIVDAGIRYFKLDSHKDDIELRYEVYYRLNLALVDMLNKFMCVVVSPMSSSFVHNITYLSYYYIFDIIRQDYYTAKYNSKDVPNLYPDYED